VSDRVWPASMVYFNKRLIVFQVKNFKWSVFHFAAFALRFLFV
jgi:hypothetical protein